MCAGDMDARGRDRIEVYALRGPLSSSSSLLYSSCSCGCCRCRAYRQTTKYGMDGWMDEWTGVGLILTTNRNDH